MSLFCRARWLRRAISRRILADFAEIGGTAGTGAGGAGFFGEAGNVRFPTLGFTTTAASGISFAETTSACPLLLGFASVAAALVTGVAALTAGATGLKATLDFAVTAAGFSIVVAFATGTALETGTDFETGTDLETGTGFALGAGFWAADEATEAAGTVVLGTFFFATTSASRSVFEAGFVAVSELTARLAAGCSFFFDDTAKRGGFAVGFVACVGFDFPLPLATATGDGLTLACDLSSALAGLAFETAGLASSAVFDFAAEAGFAAVPDEAFGLALAEAAAFAGTGLLDAAFAATTGLPVAARADFFATGFAGAFPFKEAALLDLLGAGAVSFDLGIFVFVLRRAASNSSFDIPR